MPPTHSELSLSLSLSLLCAASQFEWQVHGKDTADLRGAPSKTCVNSFPARRRSGAVTPLRILRLPSSASTTNLFKTAVTAFSTAFFLLRLASISALTTSMTLPQSRAWQMSRRHVIGCH